MSLNEKRMVCGYSTKLHCHKFERGHPIVYYQTCIIYYARCVIYYTCTVITYL